MPPSTTLRTISILLALACALVVVLGRRQTSLNRAYAELKAKVSLAYPGYVVPTVRTVTTGGDSVTIGELADTSARQVIFLLTTTCPFCLATLPVWAPLADSARALGFGVVALSLDSLGKTLAYIESHGLKYPVGLLQGWKTIRLLRATAVPQTLVLNYAGEVLYAHVGQLTPGPGLDSVYSALRGPMWFRRGNVVGGIRPSAKTALPGVVRSRDSITSYSRR